MLFNSFTFLLFQPIVFLIYWFIFKRSLKLQNAFLLLASYVFYGWWDWRFLGLIIASSALDYWCGLKMGESVITNDQGVKQSDGELVASSDTRHLTSSNLSDSGLSSPVLRAISGRNKYLTISLIFNLGMLAFFKYFNFFIESAADLISTIGFQPHLSTLNIILPVGISFYTFQTLSYSIVVYRGNLKPTKDPIAFFTFVAFFPQLVAGPIERASNLFPQFFKKREFEYQQGSDGMKLILWGLFKKMVIADNCALVVNPIFDNKLLHRK
ncbi:MBOAT family O-acyltransferase [Algoriphagus antarcticus]|uniref:MBOAT family O-acyltransferase n=1 Tax=Algoriphagus antarcticus TaxID=238540 RepID=UPI00196B4621|nr:hypothetical protein [Algoriphagus antarcticus]